MKLLVFGSRSLTARHLPVMRWHMLAAALYRLDREDMGSIPLEWINGDLPSRMGDDACFVNGPLALIHGDGPPGKVRNSIGADKLSTVAALLEWPSGWRARTFPPEPIAGETWAAAALRRNAEMVKARPDYALCFHTDPGLGRGSAHTARLLTEANIRWRLILMRQTGDVVYVEDR